MKILLEIILVYLGASSLDAKIMTLQADFQRNKDNHPVWDLSRASNGKALILHPDKSLSLNFCLRRSTAVMVHDFRFANGNRSETVLVEIDRILMGIFQTPSSLDGQWDNFMSTGQFPRIPRLPIGWHTITVKLNGTADGIAVDKIDFNLNDEIITPDIFSCELSCIPDQNFNLRANDHLTENSFIVQESYKTTCPEVDNINVPIFNPSVQEYELTAALPQYRAFSNWRHENTTGCPHLSPILWSFNDIRISATTREQVREKTAKMYFSMGHDIFSRMSLMVILQFRLEGKSKGLIDSEMGSILKAKFRDLKQDVRLTMRFKGSHPEISRPVVKILSPSNPETRWDIDDFSWTEFDYNLIFLNLDTNASEALNLDFLFLERRPMLPDQVQTIFKGDNIIVEAVFSNFWWLNPDSMSITLSNKHTFNNASYFRLYRPIPWNSGYAQVFVMYQDGNARLLPVPPEGVDWIPFGSSVIIGQTDPTVTRPFASITHVFIDTDALVMDVTYKDGGSSKLTLINSLSETRIVVSDIFFQRNPIMYPFATFRSMYVTEGNSDVDHVSINGIYPRHIMTDFGAVMGRSFVFHRKCMSRHLNLSPDIYIDVRRTENDVAKVHLLQSDMFQALLQRIQQQRKRLWTPRLRNTG